MILVDTNAWVSHLRRNDARLVAWLEQGHVVTCDVVLGELWLGSGLPRPLTKWLNLLPRVRSPSAEETLEYIQRHRSVFGGSGVGWADTQVVLAGALSGARVYSSDDAVLTVWRRLGFRRV